MENQSHAFIAGLFVILLCFGVIGGALLLHPPGSARMPIDLVTTHSVAGLKSDAPVRFRGVNVGVVKSIAFDALQPDRIRVRIAVDPAAPITRATFAKLSYQGINGMALIQLDDNPTASRERFPSGAVPEMELQAGLLERAEEDVRDVLLKAGRVASRAEELLSGENVQRLAAMLDSFKHTSERYGALAHEFEPSVKALPDLLEQAKSTVSRAEVTADNLAKLAADTDRKLVMLDSAAAALDGLNRDTLPRLNGVLDEISADARELKPTLHQANVRPQSFIFGLQPTTPGPGERGFTAAEKDK